MNVRPPGPDSYPDPYSGGYQPHPPPTGYGYAPPAAPAPGYQPGPSGPVTYRPSMQLARGFWTKGGIGFGVVALVLIAWRLFYAFEHGGIDELLVMLVAIFLIVGAVLGVYLAYLRTLSLTVDAGGVTRRVFGKARRIPRDVLQRVVLTSYTQRNRYLDQEVPLVALVDATGRSRLTLNLQIWAEADARALVSQLGLAGMVTSLGHRERRQLKREVPGALPWVAAHRAATVLIVMGATLVFVAIFATVAVLLTGGGS